MCRDSRGNTVYVTYKMSANCVAMVLEKLEKTSIQAGKSFSGSSENSWREGDSTGYDAYIQEASSLYGLDQNLIKAIIHTESSFNSQAISSKGAIGLMQLMPGTARDLGVDNAFDPRENILGGSRYISWQLKEFGGDIQLSLAAYNAGPNLVKRLGRIPNIPETQNYVRKVLYYYNMYKDQE